MTVRVHNLLTDELRLVTPTGWTERPLPAPEPRPFVMEPVGTTAREWAVGACRKAGFEPDVRFTSTDLQIHLRLVESGLAAALLPDLEAPVTVRTWWHVGCPIVRRDRYSPRSGVAQHLILGFGRSRLPWSSGVLVDTSRPHLLHRGHYPLQSPRRTYGHLAGMEAA